MKSFRSLFCTLLLFCLPGYADAAKLNVAASFSILADMTQQVAGDRITLTTLVPPGSDAHVYEPTPGDARNLAHADLMIINGLGFEGWMNRLITSSGFKGTVVTVSSGVTPLGVAGAYDPHAWQNIANGKIYVIAIRDALMKADPPNAGFYQKNATLYLGKLDALDIWVRAEIAKVPIDKRKAVITHNSMRYFTQGYGVTFISPLGFSTAGDPTAQNIAKLIDAIRATHLHAIFLENMTDPRLMQQLERDSDVHISGTLYSDSLSEANGDAPSYAALFRHNVSVMAQAMK